MRRISGLTRTGRWRAWLGTGVAGAVLLLGAAPGTSTAQAVTRPAAGQSGTHGWQAPEAVPGIHVRLGRRPFSSVASVSCPSAGRCTATGLYSKPGFTGAFLASQVNGTWGNARQVPGIGALSVGGLANAAVVSCGGTGNCAIGGSYTDSADHQQAFVDTESRGVWHKAEEVPGTAALNGSGNAGVVSLSCGAPGNCGAVGSTSSGPYVVNETQGTWGTAGPIPGLAALNKGNDAEVVSISCPSASSCALAGQYTDKASRTQLFVDSETGGVWGDAMQIPGTAVEIRNGSDAVVSVSCASPGNCGAVGYDQPTVSSFQPFAVTETNGVWGNAESVSGIASFTSLSCSSAGNCVAGGGTGTNFDSQAVVLREVSGTWGKALTVPGTAALNPENVASVTTVSCPSVGNCAVAGYVTQPQGDYTVALPFVENEIKGVWDKAQAYYSGVGPAGINSVSCASPENCSAGGSYNIGNGCDGKAAAFVIDQAPVTEATPGRFARPASPDVC